MNIKILFMSTFCCAFTPFVASLAQERPHDEALFSEVLKDKDPKAIARERTDEMNHLLALSDKQYKKVYKLFLKEEKKRSENLMEPEAFYGTVHPWTKCLANRREAKVAHGLNSLVKCRHLLTRKE